uniref:Chalcone isomerase domain-containing protein n=1 Tax=Dunaliella tertiolecta TaxID=3047 RepID=A0A7S3VI24_DUNTE|mmetsp:Transcript_17849/g.49899  ORF Transcript_17849/g.49899 Transcript_17849/m.49899 type:complete len:252 (+) Transcript_17849:1245-2000(+)
MTSYSSVPLFLPPSYQSSSPANQLKFQLAPVTSALPNARFASISQALVNQVPKKGNKATEPATGVPFPKFLDKLELTGLGVRAKRVLGLKTINVYALGIYCDKDAARKELYPRYGHSHPNQALLDDFTASEAIKKSLRLVITYGSLTRLQFLNALEERLGPPLKTAGELSTLEAFRKQFDDVSFEKGTEVVFSTTGKQLLTKVDNREKGMLMSPVLNRALLQVYLGPDSVTPESKKTFEVAMEALLNTSKL